MNHRTHRVKNVIPAYTAQWIYQTGEHAAGQLEIIHLARSIVREITPRDHASEALAIYDFLHSKIRYTLDPQRFEVVFGPHALIKLWNRYGKWAEDCDTITCACYALLRSIGHTCRVHIGAYTWPPVPEHIYIDTLIQNNWLAIDPTLPAEDFQAMLADEKFFWFIGPPNE